MPIASIMRTKYGVYPEYHTSDDNFKVVTKKGLTDSFRLIKDIIEKFDKEIIPISTLKCEPFLSKRKLYPTISTGKVFRFNQKLLDFLMYSDGTNRISDIEKKLKQEKKETKKFIKF